MAQILVWKCPSTGKLFEDKDKYKKHLAKVAKERRVRRHLEIEDAIERAWWAEVQNTEMDLEQLQKFIIENQMKFWAGASTAEWEWSNVGKVRHKGVLMPIPELVEFTKFNLRWSDHVSNSHCAPFNGVTNWGRERGKPTGYPGWNGRVEWRIKWPKEFDGHYPGSDLFSGSHVGIHTGTGGGGGMKDGHQSFGYDVTIFAEDWPGLARMREKLAVWKIMADEEYA